MATSMNSGAGLRLTRPAWKLVLRSFSRGFVSHQLPDGAAALTYFAALALAPSVVVLISILAIAGSGKSSVTTILATVHDVAPDSAIAMLKDPLEKFAASPSVGYALVAGILISIWATSSYVSAFGRAMNRIYELPEGRPLWKLKPYSILVALVVLILGAITVAALALTEPVADGISQALGLSSAPSLVLTVVKWPALVLAVVFTVAILYYVTPNARRPGFRVVSAGAMGAVIVLVLVSLAFAFYVANFAHYDRTYSVFAGIVVVLIWIWIANLTLLSGAEFDIQFERARELERGVDADEKIFVTPRDTEVSDRNVLKRREEIADAEKIRRAGRTRR